MMEIAEPQPALAAELLGLSGPVQVTRLAGAVPGWQVSVDGKAVGWLGSSWEIANTVGYSGDPLMCWCH